jgi:hypothetical protein
VPRDACDYAWAAIAVGPHRRTLGDLGVVLGVQRHRARRILINSPAVHVSRLVRRRWQAPDGRVFTRSAWSVPVAAIRFLVLEREAPAVLRLARRLRTKRGLPSSWMMERARFLRVAEKAASKGALRDIGRAHTPVPVRHISHVSRRSPGGRG